MTGDWPNHSKRGCTQRPKLKFSELHLIADRSSHTNSPPPSIAITSSASSQDGQYVSSPPFRNLHSSQLTPPPYRIKELVATQPEQEGAQERVRRIHFPNHPYRQPTSSWVMLPNYSRLEWALADSSAHLGLRNRKPTATPPSMAQIPSSEETTDMRSMGL